MKLFLCLLAWAICYAACNGAPTAPTATAWPLTLPPKIQFDISALNSEGLAGPPDGLRAVNYEFCIPAALLAEVEVKALDPSVQFFKGAAGHVGCTDAQELVIGSTHQKNFKQVLLKLAALDYVKRIIESVGE